MVGGVLNRKEEEERLRGVELAEHVPHATSLMLAPLEMTTFQEPTRSRLGSSLSINEKPGTRHI